MAITQECARLLAGGALIIGGAGLMGCAEEPAAPQPSAEQAAETTPEPEPVEATGPECLVGTWLISNEQLQHFYDDAIDTAATFTVDGDTRLSFTDTEYEFDADFTLEIDLGMLATGHLVGTIGGDYTASPDVLTTMNESNDVSLTVEAGGMTMDGTEEFEGLMEMFSVNDAPYECTGDTLVLHFKSSGEERVPVTLTEVN